MNRTPVFTALLITLLTTHTQATPYNIDYFMANPADISEQLDICAINVVQAKVNGNLAAVKAAKNEPACLAAKQARTLIKQKEEAQAHQEYEARKARQKAAREKALQMAQQNTMQALETIKKNCDTSNSESLECDAIYPAIRQRETLDKESAIASYRNRAGKMTELERFTLLATHGECRKAYDYDTCNQITAAQRLDEQEYRDTFDKDRNAAQTMLEKCKVPFMKAVAAAKSIQNPGDRMREMGKVVNLYKPPFDNPLECKTAASVLGTAFGQIAYE